MIIVNVQLVSNKLQMQGISDPETFELSQIVEKSSKSGIFTNKRLLMIKDGFLYYFSNVPADYKTHQPNLMSTLKEFPKCSIEIRSIQSIKLQSAKSSTLIITFYDRDMIDREDIRKSLSSKNYNHPVKPNRDDLEEWKFIFATVMKCRLWYGSLVKLKQYFVKSQDKFDKFAEYMANFDPQIRSSLPQLTSNRASAPSTYSSPNLPPPNSPTRATTTVSPQSKYKMEKQSGIFQIQESNEQYDQQITPKNNIIKLQEKEKEKQKKIDFVESAKIELKPIVIEEIENNSLKQEVIVPKNIQKTVTPKGKSIEIQQKQVIKEPEEKQTQQVVSQKVIINVAASEQSSKQLSIAEDIRRQQQRLAQEEAIRAEKQAAIFNQQLQQQQELIRKMSQQIQNNKRAKQQLEEKIRQQQQRREEEQRLRLMLQREKRQEEEYKRLRQSIKSQPPLTDRASKERVVREESIQTEYERELLDVMEGGRQTSKLSRYSFKSDLSLNPLTNQRQTLNLFRNTISYISEVKIEANEVQSYDYFWEVGQIYRTSDVKQRISRQLQLAEFVNKASQKASQLIVHYIDFNRPKQPITIDRNMFEIQIVCERGKLIRTEGSQRLIYPNENHQRLKRCFKIYNQLNQTILSILKKKPSFPLRVPFACLVEYKGYTALAKITPPLRDSSLNAQYLKFLGPEVPVYNLKLNDFDCRGTICSIIQPTIFFKPTKEDETSIVRFPEKNYDFLSNNRKANISISSKKLFEQSKQVETNSKQRLKIAEIITFCRQLKKIMKANTPYTDDLANQFQFFDDFLKHPGGFMQIDDEESITGLLLYYIQRILGIKIKAKLSQSDISHFAVAVKRKFTLTALDVSAFANNFERYLCEKKYDLAEKSLGYSKQLEQDYSDTLMKEVNIHISLGKCQEALQRLQLVQQMLSIHDPRRLRVLQQYAQCLQAAGEVSQALSILKTLLEQTEYFYGTKARDKIVEVYFLIADLLSRQSLISELIQVYRTILHESPQIRPKVLLDFARNLLREQTDPHILLDFLQKELPQAIQQSGPEVQHLLGQLYYRAKNRPKAQGFFMNALTGMLTNRKHSHQVYEIFKRGIECCGSLREKKACHRQMLGKINAAGFSEEEQCRKMNTHVCTIISEGLTDGERDNIIIFLEYHKGSASAKLLEWGWLQVSLKKIGKSQQTPIDEKNLLSGSIDKNAFSEALILQNNPNLI